MADGPGGPPKDSLGLDLDSLKITDDKGATPSDSAEKSSSVPTEQGTAAVKPEVATTASAVEEAAPSVAQDAQAAGSASQEQGPGDSDGKKPQPTTPAREKKKPYVNPERVKTGGAPRVRLASGYSALEEYG